MKILSIKQTLINPSLISNPLFITIYLIRRKNDHDFHAQGAKQLPLGSPDHKVSHTFAYLRV